MNKVLWQQAVAFHGHECPGLAIGFKACEVAMQEMKLGRSADEELVCVVENDACGVDAVQVLLGCSLGKGNLLLRHTGKQVYNFFNRTNGDSLRLYLKARKEEGIKRSAWQEWLLAADGKELFAYGKPAFALPETARLFTTVICELCQEGAPEHKMHLQEGKVVCQDCFRDYGRGW